MTLPQLMFKTWDGDANERFTFNDMNRLGYNANIVAREAGVTQVTFVEVTRASQFRYDEMQKLEDLISSIALTLGVSITEASAWAAGDSLTYADFERVEANLFACYQAIGGIGDRIEDNKYLISVQHIISPDEWSSYPYTVNIDVPMLNGSAEAVVYVPHTATIPQRVAEQEARMVASVVSDRIISVVATGMKPEIEIPLRITLGGFSMIETHTLSASGWGSSSTGPWTQDITLADTPQSALVGMAGTITSEQSDAYVKAGLHVSAVDADSKTVTVRAIYSKPSVAIPVSVMYSTTEVV